MQVLVGEIRKIVVLVLLIELVLQMQPGKQYEPFVRILAGVMVVYTITSRLFGMGNFSDIEEFSWDSSWYSYFTQQAAPVVEAGLDLEETETLHKEQIQVEVPKVSEIYIEPVTINRSKIK